MPDPIRNRIKTHRRVRAGDLVPHELNFRLHPENQRAALEALYREVGFARSLLAYELPDGRLKLLHGHLRRDLDPDMVVDVEILDVNDDEARALHLRSSCSAGSVPRTWSAVHYWPNNGRHAVQEIRELGHAGSAAAAARRRGDK